MAIEPITELLLGYGRGPAAGGDAGFRSAAIVLQFGITTAAGNGHPRADLMPFDGTCPACGCRSPLAGVAEAAPSG